MKLCLALILTCFATLLLGAERFSISLPAWVSSLSFSPDGKQLAVGCADSSARLLQADSGKEVAVLRGHGDYVAGVAFSADGKTLVTGSYDHTAMLWNVESHAATHTLRGHRGVVTSVAFSPDGKALATASLDSTVKLWDSSNGELRLTLSSHKSWVNAIVFSADGKWLISGSSDGTIKIWSVPSGKLDATLNATDAEVRSVAISPDGQTLAAGIRYGMLKTWDFQQRRELRAIKAHESDVWAVAFSPDSRTLFSGDGDWNKQGQVKAWNPETLQLQNTYTTTGEVLSVACSPDGRTIAAGCGDGSVRAWTIAATAAEATGNRTALVDPFFMLSGALLKDNFDGPGLDTNLWSRPPWLVENHKTIGVKIESGHLVISGASRPEKESHQYAGVISKYFRDTDVVLAAEMQVQSPFAGQGRIQHMVHLCSGDYPDFFTEVIFGKIASTEAPRWHAAYLGKVWEYSGHGKYLDPTLPPTGSEATQWHTVALTHDGATSMTQNYLVMENKWIPIGPTHSVRFNHTHIELKVDVNVRNVPVQMAVDNVRLYPNPANNPVTIVIYTGVSGGKPKSPIHNQKVQILDEASADLLGEAFTDEGGEARISLRTDVLYPVAATITVSDGATPIVHAKIPRRDVNGLYPGDVWALDFRHKRK